MDYSNKSKDELIKELLFLKQKEETITGVLNNTNEAVYQIEFDENQQKTFKYISDNVENVMGISAKEYIKAINNDSIIKYFHPDDLVRLKEETTNFSKNKNKNKKVATYRFYNPKLKKYVWIEEVLVVYFNEKKEKKSIFGTAKNVTKKIEIEKKLQISEKSYRDLFDNSPDLIYVQNREGKFIDVNKTVLEKYGYEKSEIIGQSADFFDDLKSGKNNIPNVISKLEKAWEGKKQVFEFWGKKKDGSIFPKEVIARKGIYFGEEVLMAFARDITAKKIVELHLKENEEKYRTIFTKNLAGVFITENDKIVDCNNSFAKIFGYKSRVELIGKSALDIYFTKKDRDLYIKKLKEQGSLTNYKIRHKNRDGNEIWILTNVSIKGKNKIEGTLVDITEQVNNENRLKEEEENFRNLIENSPYGTIVHVDRKILFASKRALEILGLEKEYKKYNTLDFLLPAYHSITEKRLKKIMKGENVPFIELKIKKPSTGEVIEVSTKSSLINYKGEKAVQIVFKDITTEKELEKETLRAQIAEESNKLLQKEIAERIKAEKKLIENQKYTNSIINSSLDIICAADNKGNLIEFNRAAENAFGYKLDAILNKGVSVIYADKEEYIKVINELEKNGNFTGEVLNKRKNGELFTSFLSASVLFNEEGESIGTMGVSRDISELKEAEFQLIESEERYRDLFENSSDLIQSVDQNGNIEFINEAWKKTIGYSEKEILNQNIFNFIHPDSKEHCQELFKKFFNTKGKNSSERVSFELKTKNGNKIILEGDIGCKYKGDSFSTRSILRNVTEERMAEQELRNSLKEKEVLLKEVHHRVKNNLQVISSILNLQSSYVKDQNTLEILKESQNRIKSMSFIHESLYQTNDFSKINFPEYINNLSKNLVHSYGILDDLVDLKVKTVPLFLNLDLSIPCGLIVNELVSNALKYAFFDRGQKGEININLLIKEENVCLIIEDNGVGLPKNIDYKNTETLGLQLVMSLVEQIEGKIELNTQKGTKYTITFKKEQ